MTASSSCWPARTRSTSIPHRAARAQPAGVLALIGIWYRNFHGAATQAILPTTNT